MAEAILAVDEAQPHGSVSAGMIRPGRLTDLKSWGRTDSSALGRAAPALLGPGAEIDYAASHPLRPMIRAGSVTWINYAAGGVLVSWLASPHVPQVLVFPWIAGAVVFLMLWGSILVTMAVRRPSAEESVLVWGRAAQFIILGAHVILVWAIWVLLPHCPQTIRILIGTAFVACSPVQIVCSPENVTANRLGIVATSSSLVAFFLLFGDPVEWGLAGFIAMIAISLFLFCDIAQNTTVETVAARQASEDTARKLEQALGAVAAERDAKTQFIATASHDLAQPLQAARLFFDQMQRAPDAAHRSRAADGVQKAFEAADQMLSHMLSHLRLEADAVIPHCSWLSLAPVLGRISAQFGPAAKAAGITITVARTRSRLWTDRTMLERALGNLVDNAIQHSGATRILLGVRRSGPHEITLWVIDNGRGIPSDDGERIFETYYRGAPAHDAVKSGFGLGLASVRRIADLLEGDAKLDTRWIHGAAFALTFPIAPKALEVHA